MNPCCQGISLPQRWMPGGSERFDIPDRDGSVPPLENPASSHIPERRRHGRLPGTYQRGKFAL